MSIVLHQVLWYYWKPGTCWSTLYVVTNSIVFVLFSVLLRTQSTFSWFFFRSSWLFILFVRFFYVLFLFISLTWLISHFSAEKKWNKRKNLQTNKKHHSFDSFFQFSLSDGIFSTLQISSWENFKRSMFNLRYRMNAHFPPVQYELEIVSQAIKNRFRYFNPLESIDKFNDCCFLSNGEIVSVKLI